MDDTAKDHGQDELLAYLRDETQLKKAPPRTIMSGDGTNPFAHYSPPIIPDKSSLVGSYKTRRRGTKRLSTKSLPDVLNIRLPSSSDNPVDMASPESNPRETKSVESIASTLEPPVSSSGSSSAIKRDSANAQQEQKGQAIEQSQNVTRLLKLIPDLSFMLSSKLSSLSGD